MIFNRFKFNIESFDSLEFYTNEKMKIHENAKWNLLHVFLIICVPVCASISVFIIVLKKKKKDINKIDEKE